MTIVGYTFNAENYTPGGVLVALANDERFDGWQDRSVPPMSVEANLSEMAAAFGIDRGDERSFDSGDFPKTIDDALTDIGDDEEFVDEGGNYVLASEL